MKQRKLIHKVYEACTSQDTQRLAQLRQTEFAKILKRRAEGKKFDAKWTVVRWSRVLEEDTSLSVDFAELAWMEGIELLKLEETGCVTLRPEAESGKWETEAVVIRR